MVDPGDKDYHRRNVILPQELAEKLYDWHGGQTTMVYSLASVGSVNYVSPSMIDAAVGELEYDFDRNKTLPKDRRWTKKEIKELEDLIGELDGVARFSSEFSTEEHGLGDVDSGYADWLMTDVEFKQIKKKNQNQVLKRRLMR